MKLSILMPVYNEAETVQNAIKRLLDVEFPCQVEFVVVDDASTDGTSEASTGMPVASVPSKPGPRVCS